MMSTTKKLPTIGSKEKSNLLFLGPGTLIMIMALAVYANWQVLKPNKVMIERKVATTASLASRNPSVSDLLSWDGLLKLSPKQKEGLVRLQEQEKLDLKSVNQDIETEMGRFDAFMKNGERHSISSVQSAAAVLSPLSKRKREIEQEYAEKGISLLRADQKESAHKALQELRVSKSQVQKRTGVDSR